MTLSEKLRALALWAERPGDPADIKWRLLVLLDDIDREIEKKRPGYLLDQRLGGDINHPGGVEFGRRIYDRLDHCLGDKPINLEDRT